jgi:hypothetical protein
MPLVLEILPLSQGLKERTGVTGNVYIFKSSFDEIANSVDSDIEDTLLQLFITRVGGGRKFSKLDVKRVYFGNWLRDYSQAVDVCDPSS